ncbi:cytochrome P450 2J6-like [Rhipicephalus sanguineus]|uniref:cytochrome P450 2J6-like n=1 Tax=Rhipicephalus sanguineus TaxID=34632 RepID=UPI0018954054|nr:cytochrome P450 2J6-like [Rhipicephalus sanguineus]
MLGAVWIYVFVSLIAGLAAVLMQDAWQVLKRVLRRDLPPGPRGFPLLGYLPFMFKAGHLEVDSLRKKYGNIFGLHLGSRYVVFLCDRDSMAEAFSHNALLLRPVEFPLSLNPEESVITLNGPIWQRHRHFFVKMLKKLGAGTPVMEAHIQKELSHLLRELNARNGDPLAPHAVLTGSVSNIMTMVLASRRFGQDHPQRARINDFIDVVAVHSSQVLAINFFPSLRSVFSCLGLGSCGRLRKAFLRRTRIITQLMSENARTYQEGTVRNFSDGFISEMKNGQEGNETFTRDMLIGDVGSLIGGGTGTTRTALEWLMVMSAAHPSQQSLVTAETDAVMKEKEPGSRITWSDRLKMPYAQAFIWETLRCKPVNPLSPMRCASDHINLGGYFIPRGSIVIPAFWSLFNDPSLWKDPELFCPERFLTDSGHLVTKPKWFIPFSSGKRSCPAESVASMVVFVYFTNILHQFTIEISTSGVHPNDEVPGLTVRPKSHELVFKPREYYPGHKM